MNWYRKKITQHKELRTPRYKQRVVPMEKQELLSKADREEFLEDLTELEIDEYNDSH